MTNSIIDRTIGFQLGGVRDTEIAFTRPLGDGLYSYARRENPTVADCERALAKIENAKACLLAPCGMAAINIALSIFNDPKNRRPYLFPADAYSGTLDYAATVLRDQRGMNVRLADPAGERSTTENLINAVEEDAPAVVFIEPISNPFLDIIDVPKVAAAAHKQGAMVVVDNTFGTPYLFQPLENGADIVVHSGTKYLAGHNNILVGAIGVNDNSLRARLHLHRNAIGSVISPDDAGRLKTQLLTFPLRLERQNENAMRLAAFLNGHPAVAHVRYPGLPAHGSHDLARHLFGEKGFGAMITFDLACTMEKAVAFVDELSPRIPHIGSLGDVHTSFLHVQACFGKEYDPSTIRLSVGIEPADEIIGHLEQVLSRLGKGAN
jgi:cystathionine beta-lyase/cystathionine gamma-synthase